MHRVTFYVPESHLDQVKQAVFAVGAGRIGNYDQCYWQTRGQGQYRPLPGSDAFLGETNQLQQEAEYKVELVCQDTLLQPVLCALIKAHPYETPAYEAYPIVTVDYDSE